MCLAELPEFENLIVSMAYDEKMYVNNNYAPEDVAQELRLHLYKNYDKLEFYATGMANGKDREAMFMAAKNMMRNKISDIVRHQSRRADTSDFALQLSGVSSDDEQSFINQEDEVVSTVTEVACMFSTRQLSSPEMYESSELEKVVLNWVSLRDPETKQFIMQSWFPSVEMESNWAAMQEKSPRYRSWETPPPATKAKMLGISKKKMEEIMAELSNHLKMCGFGLQGNC
jgi:hypothetical protein